MYIHTDTCTHRHMYMHTQTHTHTHTCTSMQTHVHIHTCTYTQTHVHAYADTHTCVHTYKKLQHFLVHSQSRVLHCRGRQRAQHTLFPLLSLCSVIE
ncbi:unnamed protein product, partial [Staurois parvus]